MTIRTMLLGAALGLALFGGFAVMFVLSHRKKRLTGSEAAPVVWTPQAPGPRVISMKAGAGFLRPTLSPIGSPWPSESGYVNAYVIGCTGGLSAVTVDRSEADSDVWLRLVAAEGGGERVCLVKAGTSFTMKEVRKGGYEVRFQDLTTGAYGKTRPFTLTEAVSPEGATGSQVRLTLTLPPAAAAPGSEEIVPITAAEF